MKKTKIIITAAIMAALVTATACGGKDQASTPTEAQTTTTAVKQVNSINTENTIDKQEATEASVENTASSNEEVLVAEAVTEENQGNSDSVEEINNTVPAAAEDINAAIRVCRTGRPDHKKGEPYGRCTCHRAGSRGGNCGYSVPTRAENLLFRSGRQQLCPRRSCDHRHRPGCRVRHLCPGQPDR